MWVFRVQRVCCDTLIKLAKDPAWQTKLVAQLHEFVKVEAKVLQKVCFTTHASCVKYPLKSLCVCRRRKWWALVKLLLESHMPCLLCPVPRKLEGWLAIGV